MGGGGATMGCQRLAKKGKTMYVHGRLRLRNATSPNRQSILLGIQRLSEENKWAFQGYLLLRLSDQGTNNSLSCTGQCSEPKLWSWRFRIASWLTVHVTLSKASHSSDPWVHCWKRGSRLLYYKVLSNTENANKNSSSTMPRINYSNVILLSVPAKIPCS